MRTEKSYICMSINIHEKPACRQERGDLPCRIARTDEVRRGTGLTRHAGKSCFGGGAFSINCVSD